MKGKGKGRNLTGGKERKQWGRGKGKKEREEWGKKTHTKLKI